MGTGGLGGARQLRGEGGLASACPALTEPSSGLIIVNAWYGKFVNDRSRRSEKVKVIDVTVPLQCLVKDSKLILTEASKVRGRGPLNAASVHVWPLPAGAARDPGCVRLGAVDATHSLTQLSSSACHVPAAAGTAHGCPPGALRLEPRVR